MVDHLSSQAIDAHFNHILDTISRGRDGFGPLKVLMLDSYEVRPTVDWTNGFQQEFHKRNGYDPAPWLPVLAGWKAGDENLSARFRHDYQKLVSDLMIENHFARGRDLLHKRGLQLLAEAGHGGHPRVDPLKALGAADIPMGEFWNQNKNWVTKEASSASHIYGHRLVNAETLTGWRNWQDGPAAYKRLYDLAFCAGLNQASFHTFAHNPPVAGKPGFAYHAGEHFNVNSTWWPYAKPMLDDMSRTCHMLQQGLFVADVCAYYCDEAPNLVPSRRIPPGVQSRWPDEMCPHCGMKKPVNLDSLGQGYDYDYINEDVILNRMKVKDGKLVLPDGMSYRMMVLPDRDTISPEALRRIGELVAEGATVSGRRPRRSNSLRGYPQCDSEVRELADRIWGTCDGETVRNHSHGKGKIFWNVPLKNILAGMGVPPDFVVESPDNSNREIDYIHRMTDAADIYFVANTSTEHRRAACKFRVPSGRVPSFWRPDDGSVLPCPVYQTGDGFIRLTVDLAPSNSVFVVFQEIKHDDHLTSVSSPHAGSPAIEVLGFDDDKVTARVWQAGDWQVESAKGLKGSIAVREVSADQSVTGPWQVSFPENLGAPSSIIMETLADWTTHDDPGVRHFSGTANYQTRFKLSSSLAGSGNAVILDLGEVREVAEVRVNGHNAGILWKQPNRADITARVKPGENLLEIAVANLWNNRIVGDLKHPDKPPVARTNLKNKFNAKSPLLPSGLLGPVTLRFPVTTTATIQR